MCTLRRRVGGCTNYAEDWGVVQAMWERVMYTAILYQDVGGWDGYTHIAMLCVMCCSMPAIC